jgi:hypothetical protein
MPLCGMVCGLLLPPCSARYCGRCLVWLAHAVQLRLDHNCKVQSHARPCCFRFWTLGDSWRQNPICQLFLATNLATRPSHPQCLATRPSNLFFWHCQDMAQNAGPLHEAKSALEKLFQACSPQGSALAAAMLPDSLIAAKGCMTTRSLLQSTTRHTT